MLLAQRRHQRARLARPTRRWRCRRSSRWPSGATSGSRWSCSSPACRRSPPRSTRRRAIDGAGRWQAFRYVTLPMLRPTILFMLVITTIGYLQLFEEPFVMTDGGPLDADPVGDDVHVPAGLHVLPPGLRIGDRLRPVRDRRGRRLPPVPVPPADARRERDDCRSQAIPRADRAPPRAASARQRRGHAERMVALRPADRRASC